MAPTSPRPRALDGIRVVDFSWVRAGPWATRWLGALGAEIIKIEQAPGGDPGRLIPFIREGRSGFFVQQNRGKQSLCLDMRREEARQICLDLAKECDVVLENFAPGAMDRLGLGWEDVHRINPRTVYCALKGFLPGPYEHRPALDEIVQYQTGMAYMTGPPGQPLQGPGQQRQLRRAPPSPGPPAPARTGQ